MNPLFPDVVVNGEKIASADIAAEAQMHPAPQGKPGMAWQAAARALAVRALILQEAARAGIDARPRSQGPEREESAEEAVVRAYLEAELDPPPVTEADCRAAYEARPAEAQGLSYDDCVRDIHDGLEKAFWARAARDLVDRLVAAAQIQGIDMAPAGAKAG